MRNAARTDASQTPIVEALRAAGCYVWILGLPVDLYVAKADKSWLMECKNLVGKRNPKPSRKTELQAKFIAECPTPVYIVCTPDEALSVVEES